MQRFKHVALIVLTAVTLLGSGVAVANRQNIWDWWRLRDYEPPIEIEALAEDTTMTDLGQRLFYVNYPQLEDRAAFNQHCQSRDEASIVLGCYNGNAIYLYAVEDARLDGVQQVTAAHEMLHAAYDRLSKGEQNDLHTLLDDQLASVNNQRVTDLIKKYREADPVVVYTEMHSIFGTELLTLTPELEAHYARYFTDRSAVVRYSERYEAVFTDLQNQIKRYDAELRLRKAEIDRISSELDSEEKAIKQAQAEMDSLLEQGQTQAYNQRVAGYNRQVNSYNAKIGQLKQLLNEYNRLVEERNRTAVIQTDLMHELDSRYTPLGSQ